MGLILPTDHGSVDQWDVILDAIFTTIDSHDHTTGKGAKIKMSAVTIDGDVSWSASGVSRAITDLRAIDLAPVAASTVSSLAGAFFLNASDNNELYFRTQTGTNIKITSGNSLNVFQFAGGIGGDYSAVGALLSYDDASRAYWLQQEGSPRPWAKLRTGDIQLLQAAPSITQAVTLRSPTALASGYIFTFPAALPPTTTQPIISDTSGNLTFGTGFTLNSNQSITISGSGLYHHGPKTFSRLIALSDFVATSGSVTTTTGQSGISLAAGASGVLRIPDLPDYVSISQVAIACGSAGDALSISNGTSQLVTVTPPSTTFTNIGPSATFHSSGINAVANASSLSGVLLASVTATSAAKIISVILTYSV